MTKRPSGPPIMLRGPGRMLVLIACGILIIYVLYSFAFGSPRTEQSVNVRTMKRPMDNSAVEPFHNERMRVMEANRINALKGEQNEVVAPQIAAAVQISDKGTLDLDNDMVNLRKQQTSNKAESSEAVGQIPSNQIPQIKLPNSNLPEQPVVIKPPLAAADVVEITKIPPSVIGSTNLFNPIKFTNDMFYTKCDEESEKFKNLQRLVHLDLKGAPPHVSYFKELFPLLQKMGATGLLIEYEDKFPYSGNLHKFAATNAYTAEQIKEIIKLAQDHELTTIIPLVQTFGHMEFVLKYQEFRHLRENDVTPQVIRPIHEESLGLIQQMLEQVLSLHGSAIKYIHIGCDEVYQLGTGKVKEYMKAHNMTPTDVFFQHVKKVIGLVGTRAKPLMWDDMFRKLPLDILQKSGLKDLVFPMVWQYSPRPQDQLPLDIWNKYRLIFGKVWAASSFKGATGSFKYVTDTAPHLSNHLNWIEIIKSQGVSLFEGTVLTGWQRYDHFATLCELLPVAVPTLAFSLLSLSHGCFDKVIHSYASKDILQCSDTLNISLPVYCSKKNISDIFTPGFCKFPGSKIYDDAMQLYVLEEFYRKDSIYSRQRSWMNGYNLMMNYSSTGQMGVLKDLFDKLSTHLVKLRAEMNPHFLEVYDNAAAYEWMVINPIRLDAELKEAQRKVLFFNSFRTWRQRQFPAVASDVKPPQTIDEDKLKKQIEAKRIDQSKISDTRLQPLKLDPSKTSDTQLHGQKPVQSKIPAVGNQVQPVARDPKLPAIQNQLPAKANEPAAKNLDPAVKTGPTDNKNIPPNPLPVDTFKTQKDNSGLTAVDRVNAMLGIHDTDKMHEDADARLKEQNKDNIAKKLTKLSNGFPVHKTSDKLPNNANRLLNPSKDQVVKYDSNSLPKKTTLTDLLKHDKPLVIPESNNPLLSSLDSKKPINAQNADKVFDSKNFLAGNNYHALKNSDVSKSLKNLPSSSNAKKMEDLVDENDKVDGVEEMSNNKNAGDQSFQKFDPFKNKVEDFP